MTTTHNRNNATMCLFCSSCVSYVLVVAVVIVLDMWFLGDVHMNEVQIVRYFGGKLGILGGNLGYPIMPKSGS